MRTSFSAADIFIFFAADWLGEEEVCALTLHYAKVITKYIHSILILYSAPLKWRTFHDSSQREAFQIKGYW